MRFSIWPNASQPWQEILATATHAEQTGWDGVWIADHFMPNAADVSGPVNEAWALISGLAAAVPRVRIGTLVAGNTYRHPAVLAKMATTADQISGGRIVLGIGAGWQENEHAAYGIPFYTLGERMRRLDEACGLIKSLTTESRTTFEGRYYQLHEAPLEPKPVQSPLPLLVGGGGEQKTLRIAAKWADEWNVWGLPDLLRHKMSVLDERCAEVERDPKTIQRSAQALLFLTDDPEAQERARASGRMPVMAGGVGQVQEIVGQYAEAGVNELIVPDFTLGRGEAKREVMDRFINDVAAGFRGTSE